MNEQKPHILIGRTIESLQIADDRKALRFVTTEGEVIAKCDGDCCSNTWIEHLELPALGFPAKVVSVDDLDGRREESGEYGDVTQHYGCKITTERGEIVIDYRNASNGYYGGNLSWPDDDYFYGGVHGQNISTCNWVDATAK